MLDKIIIELRVMQAEMSEYAQKARGGQRPTTTSVATFLDDKMYRLSKIETDLVNQQLSAEESNE